MNTTDFNQPPTDTSSRELSQLLGDGEASAVDLNDVLRHHLSPRQTEILLLMMQGRSRSEIAQHLNLSARTVDTVRARVMFKLHAKTNSDLVLKVMALCRKH